jgi:hypothetical protein
MLESCFHYRYAGKVGYSLKAEQHFFLPLKKSLNLSG